MRMRAAVSVVIVIALGIGSYAIAGYMARERDPCPRMMQAGTLAAQLQLSAQQRGRIGTINEQFQHRREALRGEQRAQRRELMTRLRERPPDRERIDEQIRRISETQAAMQRLAVEHILDVGAELDERQSERFFELIDEATCPGAVMGEGRRDCSED